MSFGSSPSAFSAAITSVMEELFLASASFAVGTWLVTPVVMSTLSGDVRMAPVAGRRPSGTGGGERDGPLRRLVGACRQRRKGEDGRRERDQGKEMRDA